MIKNDTWIKQQADKMIYPFTVCQVKLIAECENFDMIRAISYGVSSYGYDIRLSSRDFYIFEHSPKRVVDPKNFDKAVLIKQKLFSDKTGDYFLMPPRSSGLGVSIENFCVPENITVLCVGKSTYARAGLIVNTTPFEAGWRGHPTLEFYNSLPLPLKVYANEGIAQCLFFEGEPCEVSYACRDGKYQDQQHRVVTSKV